MTEKKGWERRQIKRIVFTEDVEIIGGSRVKSTQLGLGGMFLKTQEAIPDGTFLPLRFKLGESDSDPIEIEGRVIYGKPGVGVGIAFCSLPWEVLRRISDFIEDK
ncbi:MAG TPA: hypothetical protein VLB09_00735 [Nitrospiria bacterium]|nr:hypothetical protein [Nitrospiria bacterium]